MVSVVVKRDGREEPFILEKLVVSLLKAGVPVEEARKIARKVECKFVDVEKVSAKDLTRELLLELKRVNEEWYRNWLFFDKVIKKRATDKELGL
ncbi:MAG: ATPase [Thermoprotei archaeon ex4572_64]|nr:MAG: ATPase [Thermoprotei archaeon ex4572_64]